MREEQEGKGMGRKAVALCVAFCSVARVSVSMCDSAGHDKVCGELHPRGSYNTLQSEVQELSI